jgi:pyruvate formate lyase activating enzyme
VLEDGRTGACGVRFREGDALRVPFGYVARKYVRPVETNTLYHVRPGAPALTFGMFGCDLRCPYCHNHKVSQALREGVDDHPTDVSAVELVDEAVAQGARVLCSAYNEPMITAEWARAVFAEARARGLVTAVVSDGNTTPEALAYLRPVLDVYRLDLKGFTNEQYHALGGRLGPVMEGIREAKRLGYWVEIVTLVVPGFNDDLLGLGRLARELAAIDPSIPWHLNAFYPRYKLLDRPRTGADFLMNAAGIGYAKGLKFVYVSNLASEFSELSHTRCPECHEVVVRRMNYTTESITLDDGRCPQCKTAIPGLWG